MANKEPSMNLTLKFINGLKNYSLTYEDIKNWKYCGGNRDGRHLNYFKLCCKNSKLPETKNNCVCGHHIEENCYITDGNQILVLGNCCIKKFVPSSSRTCEMCGEPHKNRIVNRCNDCRMGICDVCNTECNRYNSKCDSCTYGRSPLKSNKKVEFNNKKKMEEEEEFVKKQQELKEKKERKEKERIEELKKRYYMCPECAEYKVPKEKRRFWTMCKDCYSIQRQKTAINTERHCLDCNIKLPETIEYWKDRCNDCYETFSSKK